MYESTVREEKDGQVVYSNAAVQWIIKKKHPFKINVKLNLQAMKGGLTPCRRCT